MCLTVSDINTDNRRNCNCVRKVKYFGVTLRWCTWLSFVNLAVSSSFHWYILNTFERSVFIGHNCICYTRSVLQYHQRLHGLSTLWQGISWWGTLQRGQGGCGCVTCCSRSGCCPEKEESCVPATLSVILLHTGVEEIFVLCHSVNSGGLYILHLNLI